MPSVVHSRGAGSSARDTRRPSRDWFSAGILAVIHPGVGARRSGQGPWHDREISAETLPFGDGTLGALVLFDVLHHLLAPGRFFPEATRVLRTGGRVIMCESYVGPFSYPVCTSSCTTSRWTWVSTPAGTGCGVRARPLRFEPSYPDIALRPRPGRLSAGFSALTLSGPSYPASGGFRRRPLLPLPLWRILRRVEATIPEA